MLRRIASFFVIGWALGFVWFAAILPQPLGPGRNDAAIVLTGNTAEKSRAQAIAAGAVGVLHKSTSISEIVDAIRRVVAGESLITPREASELMQRGNIYLSTEKEGHTALAKLSQREQDVLRALAAGLDNHAIADRLFVSHDTVRSHIVRIYRKLGVATREDAVARARERGLLPSTLAGR